MTDPIEVAEIHLGTPYLWGGNSTRGIDCSGLAQAALTACGTACPGDSDMQAQSVGRALLAQEKLERGDLVFWKGHVALMYDDHRIIHANATAMAVTIEDFAAATARIEAAGDGPVTARRRP